MGSGGKAGAGGATCIGDIAPETPLTGPVVGIGGETGVGAGIGAGVGMEGATAGIGIEAGAGGMAGGGATDGPGATSWGSGIPAAAACCVISPHGCIWFGPFRE
jgi:hypothetical protein